MQISDAIQLGKTIVVQAGTFYNDAVLRSFEKIAGVECVRPDIAGIMGAFGAALIARERHEAGYQTSMLSIEQINALTFDTKLARCQGCTNHCLLTINRFSGNRAPLPTALRGLLAREGLSDAFLSLFEGDGH